MEAYITECQYLCAENVNAFRTSYESNVLVLLVSYSLLKRRLPLLNSYFDDLLCSAYCLSLPDLPLEVAAKVRAQLRRLNAAAVQDNPKSRITVGNMNMNLDECTFEHDGEVTGLTKAEFKVLELLMSQPKRVFTKEQIYESAWYDSGAVDDNTIHVIISRLRDKVGAKHIKTIRGLGYRFEE